MAGATNQVRPDPGLRLLALYDTALPEVYGYLLTRCGRRALAEDLTAETFLAAVGACRENPPDELGTAWLVGIARHKLVDHWRRAAREERGLAVLDGQRDEVEDHWDERVDALIAREVLDTLGPSHQAALTLRYFDGLPVAEVARHLDRSRRATESLLARARAAFRAAYPHEPKEGGADD